MRLAVEQHHLLLRKVIEDNHGHVFQVLGDAFQAAFSLPRDALQASIQAQRELQSASWGVTGPLRVRMGLHTGPIELSSIPNQIGDYEYAVCHTLNRAARVMSAGHGGQILVSRETKILVERELPDGVRLRDLGEHHLKGMRRAEHLYQVVAKGLPNDFPTLTTGVGHPNNLPAEMSSFVGREKEIADLKEIINETSIRLITIVGPGGIGKTRLSLRVAEEMIEVYPDGVWLVELVSLLDPAFLPQAVAQTLHVRELPGQPLLDILQEFLNKKKLLLVLDNCEHLKLAVGELAGYLLPKCPSLKILATSREVLGLHGEAIYRCPSLLSRGSSTIKSTISSWTYRELAIQPAIQLFTERAIAVYPSFNLTPVNISAVAEICLRLDGIPLAIELAAARIRVLSVNQIATRLGDIFHLLAGGMKSKIPHHQTVKALMDWSYNLLAPVEKTMFERLSVFSGGWDLDAAEAVVVGDSIEIDQVVDLLANLLDKSLILFETTDDDQNRYRMLETIRQYANEKLQEANGHAAVRKCHLDYFSHLAEQSAPQIWEENQEYWIRRLTRENDNLRAALHWGLQREEATPEEIELGVRMATALWNYWYGYGVIKETASWLSLALERSSEPNQARARILAADGIIAWQLGELSKGASRLHEALELYRRIEDPSGLAEATHMYGHIVFDQKNYTEAERVFKDSLRMYEALKNTGIRVALIGDLGMVACHLGNLSLARQYYEQCMDLSLHHGLKDNVAHCNLRLGDISRLERDYDTAESSYRKSLKLNRELGMSREIAAALHKLGFIALHKGDFDQAQSLFQESLTIQTKVSNQQGIAECLAGLASVKVKQGDDEAAAVYFGAAREILVRTGLPLNPADLAEWIRDEEIARARCNMESFEQAWLKGRNTPINDLVAGILSSS